MSELPPERRHVLTMTVQGDTPEALLELLDEFLFSLKAYGLHSMLTGGTDRGGAVTYRENPDVTHESYVEANDLWLDEYQRQKGGEK